MPILCASALLVISLIGGFLFGLVFCDGSWEMWLFAGVAFTMLFFVATAVFNLYKMGWC